ncbi:MAG: UDP-2,3-diacylglucosamine diphosphatase [Burkholderiales bacterium]|nr:MAG: UDP-2,3-diacylglucosamine diphosphatase [Burkholderiales bacterium]
MIEVGRSAREVALFCSDMHLGDHDPRTATLFFERLDAQVREASHLFLLGDLFEAWVGDDQPDAVAGALQQRLAARAAAGTRLFVMRGNRDFLLDVPFPADAAQRPARSFGASTGATMLDDPCTVALFGEPALLAHGDALCTDDADYQQARAIARGEPWQRDFLRRPLEERLRIAVELRGESRRVQAARAMGDTDPGDVNAAAVDAAMRAAGVCTMVHGHTHRPACHRWLLDGAPAQRWVLPAWHAGAGVTAARGGFLRVDASGWSQIVV